MYNCISFIYLHIIYQIMVGGRMVKIFIGHNLNNSYNIPMTENKDDEAQVRSFTDLKHTWSCSPLYTWIERISAAFQSRSFDTSKSPVIATPLFNYRVHLKHQGFRHSASVPFPTSFPFQRSAFYFAAVVLVSSHLTAIEVSPTRLISAPSCLVFVNCGSCLTNHNVLLQLICIWISPESTALDQAISHNVPFLN